MIGKLYVVATPIGNLEDITIRALLVLKEVDLILAEDTRQTSKLLSRHEIKTPIESYHQHSSQAKKDFIFNQLLLGRNLALVTDAGTPGISDPGNELIDFLIQHSAISSSLLRGVALGDQPVVRRADSLRADDLIQIIPIPGPSALTAALSVSGMNVNHFVFLGFMPKKGRTKLFEWLKSGKLPFAFYESPRRLPKTLQAIAEAFEFRGNVVVGRELTKMHESVYRGSFEQVIEALQKDDLRGEAVIIIDPNY